MLHLFGSPGVSISGRPVRPPPQAALIWAAVLIIEYANRVARSELAAFLHEDRTSRDARHILRVHLRRILEWQRATGVCLLVAVSEMVARTDQCDLSDLDRFLAIDHIGSEADLSTILNAYGGDLLLGVDPAPSDFKAWLEVQRTRLRNRFIELLREGVEKVGAGPIRSRAMRRLKELVGEEAISAVPRTTASQSETGDEQNALRPRVAVGLPETSNTVMGYLGVGLAEEIALALCRLRSVTTIAPHTMRQVSTGERVHQDAGVLGVDYVVTTRADGSDDRLRFSLALTHRRSGVLLWSTDATISVADAHRTRLSLASGIASAIVEVVEHAELGRPAARVDRTAYLLFLRGKKHLRNLDLASVRRAKHDLRDAVAAAADFAPAYALLARTHCLEWLLLRRGESDLLSAASRAARRAIDIDPFDACGHHELAKLTLYTDGPEVSMHHFREAEALSPHHADILADAADTLSHNGDMDDAHRRIALALELNPLPPDEYRWTDGEIKFFRGEYSAALSTLRAMRDDEPAARMIAATAAMAGNMPLARLYRDRELAARPNFTIGHWQASIQQRGSEHVERFVEGLRRAGFH